MQTHEFVALGTMWFVALATSYSSGQRHPTLPNHIVPCVGAQVALQRCPILRTGTDSIAPKDRC
jgi:hypothetical protein